VSRVPGHRRASIRLDARLGISSLMSSLKTITKQPYRICCQRSKKGMPIPAARKSEPGNVINLMDALKASLRSAEEAPKASVKPACAIKKTAARPRRKAPGKWSR
jgi:hypothetical protein